MSNLSLALFGHFRAIYDKEPVTRFGSNKVQALLIYLTVDAALHPENPGRTHRREALMELLWPGLLPKSAQNNLRQTIYKLRQIFPTVTTSTGAVQDFLISERLTVQLNPASVFTLDVANFTLLLEACRTHAHGSLHTCSDCQTTLKEVVDLYQGEFLADFFLPDSNEFEDWAANQRARFRRQVLDALDTLTLMTLSQGQYNQARAYAEQQLAIDPLRESAYRQLMEILALNGQPSEALAQYERLEQLLRAEMGMAPMAQTTEVYEQIRAGELGLATASPPAARGYDLLEEIGAGAFGVVHRARQPHVNREVAIKIIAPDLANQPEFIRRFEVEAQTIARLEHPHIVPLYDYWREPDAAYLVMRFLRGGSLEKMLEGGPQAPHRVGQILEHVCAALQVAHQQDIVHRDIKPANILLDEEGNAYLSDFGIAKALGSQRQLTQAGAILGTPDFISPEQFCDEPVSPASDLYSLGIVLFQMLTGRLPFPEASLSELIYKHFHEQVPAVSHLQPGLPPTMDAVIWQATARQPKDRFPTTAALAIAFQTALQQPSMEAYPVVTVAPGIEVTNPYKGLRPFQEADSADFFGREALVTNLLSRLASPDSSLSEQEEVSSATHRFLAVVGPSGSGKSSVVKAGLIPALRRGEIPGAENWFVIEMAPGTHPFEELEAALLRVAVNPPPSLLEPLQKDERGLVRTLKRVLPPADGDERPQLLLIIDQFEELYTLAEDQEVRKHFIGCLIVALQDKRSQLRLVITLRADFYDRPLQHPALGALLRQRTEVVLPLTLAELEQAIVRPVARMGVHLETPLPATIAADVADQPRALPLLQYALTELFERRQKDQMTVAAYRTIGGVLGALGRRAEEIYTSLESEERLVTRQLLLRLLTLGEGTNDGLPSPDTRRRVLRSELVALETPGVYTAEPVLDRVIDTFGRYRLLTFDYDPVTRGPTVEVAHEALLREWDRLRGWLGHNREDVRQQRRLARAAREWDQAGRDDGFLLRGARLDLFSGWAAETQIALTSTEHAFLEASLTGREERDVAEEARRRRELETAQQWAAEAKARAEEQKESANRLQQRARYLAIALFIAAILALAAMFFGRQSNLNAQAALDNQATAEAEAIQRATAAADAQYQQTIAEQERIFAEAQAQLASSRELAALAMENLGKDPELGILLALEALQITHTLQAENALHRAILAAPQAFAFNGSADPLWAIAFSPDGEYLATGGINDEVNIWNSIAGEHVLTLPGHRNGIYDLAFSADGRHIVTSGGDNSVKVWDSHSGIKLLELDHQSLVQTVAYSPAGMIIATATREGQGFIWDALSGEMKQVLNGHTGSILGLNFSPDGEMLVTASLDGNVRLWAVDSGDEILTLANDDGRSFSTAVFSPDGTRLATMGDHIGVKLWDITDVDENKADRLLYTAPASRNLSQIVFLEMGNQYLTLGEDNLLTIRDTLTGQIDHRLACSTGADTWFVVNAEGTKIALVGRNGKVKNCSLNSSQELWTFTDNTAGFNDAAFDSQRSILYSANSQGVWRAHNLTNPGSLNYGEIIGSGQIEGVRLIGIKPSPDGTTLATSDFDGVVRIWNIEESQVVLTMRGHRGPVSRIAYSPDGALLISVGDDGYLDIWNALSGILKNDFYFTYRGTDISFSPDGNYYVAGYWEGLLIWDASKSWNPLVSVKEQELPVWTIAISPDGQYLASAGEGGVIYLWDFDTLLEDGNETNEVMRLTGHTGVVRDLSFSPDGDYLASASFDNTVKLWDLADEQEWLTLTGHTDSVISAEFTPDGKYLASASFDGTLRVYVLDLEELIELGYSRLTRWWTIEECQQYLHTDSCPPPPGED